MGDRKVRWECPQCGYFLPESSDRCDQCRYVRTGSDPAWLRDPDDTNSWIIHRLDQPSFEGMRWYGTWTAVAASVVGIGIAVLLILLLSVLSAK